MFDWEKMQPSTGGHTNYYSYPNIPTTPLTGGGSSSDGFGCYHYPLPPTKPSCFEAKCTNCPFKDKCKNKE